MCKFVFKNKEIIMPLHKTRYSVNAAYEQLNIIRPYYIVCLLGVTKYNTFLFSYSVEPHWILLKPYVFGLRFDVCFSILLRIPCIVNFDHFSYATSSFIINVRIIHYVYFHSTLYFVITFSNLIFQKNIIEKQLYICVRTPLSIPAF